MSIGSINSVQETTYGFRTKLLYFIDRIELMRKKLSKSKSDIEILDVGCSNGVQMTFPLGACGYRVTGLDSHEPSIVYARTQNIFDSVNFVHGDIKELARRFAGKKFDVVILSDILEHVMHPEQMLRDVHKLLSQHGIILISIPNGYGPFEIENFLLRKTGILSAAQRFRKMGNAPYNHESGHVQFFSRRAFMEMSARAGFYVSDFRKGCFLGGSASNFVISRISPLTKANIAIGRYLPYFMCSVWYFECKNS